MNFDQIINQHHNDTNGFSRHCLELYSIIVGMESQKVFEFGSGVSSQVIVKALEHTGGTLISCDERSLAETSHGKVDPSKYNGHWRYVEQNSLDFVPSMEESGFDVVLHDGSHDPRTVKKDIRAILPKIKQGGLLLVHDTEHPTRYRKLKGAVKSALRWTRHEMVTLPYGYGLTVVRITARSGAGKVEIKWRKQKK